MGLGRGYFARAFLEFRDNYRLAFDVHTLVYSTVYPGYIQA